MVIDAWGGGAVRAWTSDDNARAHASMASMFSRGDGAAASAKTYWWIGIALGQLCAFVNATSAAASTALESKHVYLPAWQTFFAYCAIGGAYGPMYYARVRRDESGGGYAWSKLKKYVALAAIDVEANYFVTLAFRYTSMTSVTLLDSAAIPFAMALSEVALKSKYAKAHVVGACVAFGGLSVLVLSDATAKGSSTASVANAPLGDFLTIVAAALYATSNVLVEAFLHDADKVEILAHLGVLGAAFSGTQSAILEGMKFSELKALGARGVGLFTAFASSLFVLYTFSMDVLERCGASAFNVSMLASDVWSVILRLMFFNGFASSARAAAFVISFALVAAGICIFASAGDPAQLGAEQRGVDVESTADETPAWLARVRKFIRFDQSKASNMPYAVMDEQYDLEPIELGSLGR